MEDSDQVERLLALGLVASWQIEQIQSLPLRHGLSLFLDRGGDQNYHQASIESTFMRWNIASPEFSLDEEIQSWSGWVDGDHRSVSAAFVIHYYIALGGYVRQLYSWIFKDFSKRFTPHHYVPQEFLVESRGLRRMVYQNLGAVPAEFPTIVSPVTPTRHTLAGQKIIQQILKDIEHVENDEPVD